MKTLKNIYSLIERLENRDGFLLNEISIKDKWQKESNKWQGNFDVETFEYLCSLDPTTNPNKVGRYANWILAKYNPNADFNKLKICLEWYADGIKRGIINRLGISNDINAYKSYDEFIAAMNGVMHSDDSTMSNSEYNNRQKLEGQFEILGSNSMFDIIACKTFAAERYFGSGTEWCTVANESYFNSYMKKGPLYIIYPKNGDEELKMQFHFESDSYADKCDNVYDDPIDCIWETLSMSGEQVYEYELIDLCKVTFSKYKTLFMGFDESVDCALYQLENGDELENIFDVVEKFHDGLARVGLKDKFNFVNERNELISQEWFDYADDFEDGTAIVEMSESEYGVNVINTNGQMLYNEDQYLKGIYRHRKSGVFIIENSKYKWNFLNKNGQILSDVWFDEICTEYLGLPIVKINNKFNFINENFQILSKQWFDKVQVFHNGFGCVKINEKGWNFINENGDFLTNQWFDDVRPFNDGLGRVGIIGKGCNFINEQGQIVLKNWYEYLDNFKEGFAKIKLNGKWNFINSEEQILCDQWFDDAWYFREGLAKVVSNSKENYINTEGELLSDQWFDYVFNFHNGFAKCEINNKVYKLDINGNLYDEEGNKINNKGLNESINKNIIHLTSSDLKRIIKESVKRIIQEQESHTSKVVGEYNVIEGGWWDGLPYGLESKGAVQDIRMYDKRTNDDMVETIALFRRCDNLKYFYARIIPIKGTNKTKWEQIKLIEVPDIIKKDFTTINPQGHEPYLRI